MGAPRSVKEWKYHEAMRDGCQGNKKTTSSSEQLVVVSWGGARYLCHLVTGMFSPEQIADLLSCRFGQLPECFPRPRVERGAFEADIAELQGSDCSRSELSRYGDVCIASRGVFATCATHGSSPFQKISYSDDDIT